MWIKRNFAKIYFSVLGFLALCGIAAAGLFSYAENGMEGAAFASVGLILSLIFAPTLHEAGHIFFAKRAKMRLKYTKFFCFRFAERGGKLHFSFASPFAAEETQTIPSAGGKTGGDMKKRALYYTAGGLIFGGGYLLLLLAAIIVGFILPDFSGTGVQFLFWGGLPYAAYLFLLNVLPLEYPSGKTDALIWKGLKKGYPAEAAMLDCMEIYGLLSEGKSFSEIDETYYFASPQLAEDQPMYAMTLDLRYRYYLDKGDLKGAADCLNRLASSAEYLPKAQTEALFAELAYMHALNGDKEKSAECERAFKGLREGKSAVSSLSPLTEVRIKTACAEIRGDKASALRLRAEADAKAEEESIAGVIKFEKSRIERDEKFFEKINL